MLIDSIFALAIILLLAGLMTIAIHQRQRMASSLADSRDAARLAERALTALQTRSPAPAAPAGATIQVHPLAGSPSAEGMQWTRVAVKLHGRSVSLIGMVPARKASATTSTTRRAR